MGIFSFIGGLLGGGAAKKASSQAQAAQMGFLNQALGQERQQYDTTRSDFAPWRTEGGAALGQQSDLLGLHGNDPQAAAIAQLQQSPLYQSLYRNGLEANLQNASATGGIRGGNEARGLADFGRDTLTSVIQNQLGNLGSMSGQGLASVGGTAQSGDALSSMISQILGDQGRVTAGGILTRGAINQNMWGNAGGFLDQAMQAIAGQVGGGFGSMMKGF